MSMIQECQMMFSELENNYGFCNALAELRTEIERFLYPLATDDKTARAERIAAAFADVYRRLEDQR